MAVLAEALGRYHDVEIVHHRASLSAPQLEELFAVELRSVRLRYLKPELNLFGTSSWPTRRYQEAKEWHQAVSQPYDLFVNFTHYIPPFCHARMGVLMILFPFYDPSASWPNRPETADASSLLWKSGRKVYYSWEWKRRMASYGLKLANSHFTAKWTLTRWGVKPHILYPPVNINLQSIEKKENCILSVGRFTPLKKQLEMASIFARLNVVQLPDWTWICAGTVGDSLSSRKYYEKIAWSVPCHKIRLARDLDYPSLKHLYQRSKIFWHGVGLDEDDLIRPELSEHFGMATVEAMAAGAVPVVINKGGQQEIVEHRVNGFLWNSIDELSEYTLQLAKDERLRIQMSKAARVRAQYFSREAFVDNFRNLVQSCCSTKEVAVFGRRTPKPRTSIGV